MLGSVLGCGDSEGDAVWGYGDTVTVMLLGGCGDSDAVLGLL